MITSMTGFGRGAAAENGIQVTVEIKTLNSRYLDISTRIPHTLIDREPDLKELVQKKINRGKVNISVNVDKADISEPDITFNPEMVKSYSKLLEHIKFVSGIPEPVELSDLLKFDDIFVKKPEDEKTVQTIWSLTETAGIQALEMVVKMRRKEGGQLKNELKNQIDGIDEQLDHIIRLSEDRAPEAMKRLKQRLSALLQDDSVDAARLEQEVAILVDKMDIQEEVIRLQSHLKFFYEALGSSDSVGRRLNFLCQEINRELNTIGSKANESGISHLIVFAKEKLEQIREQVQNIE
ncbi:MAG: YicC/YloC family endoribonuclease [Balneolaceae bacterium]